jgi:hypothetical protein
MRELDSSAPEAWAKESYEIATKIAYEAGASAGHQKARREIVGKSEMLISNERLSGSREAHCRAADLLGSKSFSNVAAENR